MTRLTLVGSVLGLVEAISLQAADPAVVNEFELLSGSTDDILDALDAEFGSHEWVPPIETRGTFENDLNNILDDFYEKAGKEFGDD